MYSALKKISFEMYFHPSFLRVKMIERLFTQTYAAHALAQSICLFVEIYYRFLSPPPPLDFQWRVMSWRRGHDMQCMYCLGLTDGVSSFSAHTQGEGRAL